MHKLSDLIKKLAVAKQRNEVASHPAVDLSMEANADKLEDKLPQVKQNLTGVNICLFLITLYFYGVLVGSVKNGIALTFGNSKAPLFDWNPFASILTAISPFGIIFAIGAIAFCFLFSEKFRDFLAGEKNQKYARGFTVLSAGTHGTSGFMNEAEKALALNIGNTEQIQGTLLGKLNTDEESTLYAAVKPELFLNGHILVFGASGAGKTTGFTIPFVLQKIRSKQRIIVVDPKGDLYEKTADFARSNNFAVKAYNLLDMENSDGFNCLNDVEKDPNLVQTIAEVIIKNISNANERQDFWEKAEKNLLMALIMYVESMKDASGNKLPIHQRSIGKIYKILSTESFTEIDDRFAMLPTDHPAQAPYGIFKLANRQIWGNIAVGLGNRLSVYQNELVDKISSYHEIDLELPGKSLAYIIAVFVDIDAFYSLRNCYISPRRAILCAGHRPMHNSNVKSHCYTA